MIAPEPDAHAAYRRLATAARDRVDRARARLADAWAAESFVHAINEAIACAIPGNAVSINGWDLGPIPRIVTLASTVPVDITRSPWMSAAIRHSSYDPRDVDPLRNKAVLSAEMRAHPGWPVFQEMFLDPLGLADQLRATLYDGNRFLAHVAAFRERGARRFDHDDADTLTALLPDVRRLLSLRRTATEGMISADDLLNIVDAIGKPAFLGTCEGCAIHANHSARAAYRECAGWLPAAFRGDGIPPWVDRIVISRANDVTWVLVLVDALRFGAHDAAQAPWALDSRLPPRLAAVASGILRGLSDKEIASEMGISVSSARTYVRRLFARVGAHDRAALVALLTRRRSK